MKKSLLLISLATAAFMLQSCASHKTKPDAQTIRFMSYNVHYGLGTDDQYDLERLAKVINNFRPDIVALQEVEIGVERSGRVDQARRFAELTGMRISYGPAQTLEGGFFGNAVLSRFPVLDVNIQPLPYTETPPGEPDFPRSAIAVTVELPGGQPLRVVSTHFMHLYPEDRVAEAEAINKLFANEADSTPTLFGGDLNAKPWEEPVQILEQRWLNVTDDPPSFTAPSVGPVVKIDYILARPAEVFRVLDTGTIAEPVASDHVPLWAILEVASE